MLKYFVRVVLILALYISGPLFLLTTNPKNLALPLLIVPYIWLYATIVCSLGLVHRLMFRRPLSQRTQLGFGLVALVPVLLAVMQSIHQLSVKDVVLVLVFVMVAGFYISRLDLGTV